MEVEWRGRWRVAVEREGEGRERAMFAFILVSADGRQLEIPTVSPIPATSLCEMRPEVPSTTRESRRRAARTVALAASALGSSSSAHINPIPMRTSLQSLGWRSLAAAPCELRLHATLDNGQCFGWRRQPGDDAVWVGVLGQRLVGLRETEGDCLFRCLSSSAPGGKNDEKLLRDELREYFQLDTDLRSLYDKWSRADPRMKAIAKTLPGMRVLRQEPVECLFSFICSSNNNIQRIGGMLHTLRKTYGEVLPAPGSTPGLGFEPVGHGDAAEFYTFPTAERLAAASEAELRALGLGYRAAYVRQTAAAIVEAGPEWLPACGRATSPTRCARRSAR